MTYLQAPMPPEKNIIVFDSKISYYEQGQGETIFLLHGWPQTSYVWRKVIPKLAESFRVIAIDLPGTGNSDAAFSHDTLHIATVVNEFASILSIESFHLVGHDIGCWVAVTFALTFESRLKTLTVIDAGIPGLISPAVFQPENAGKVWQFYFHAINDIPEMLLEGKEKEYLSWYFVNKSFIKTAITEEDLEVYYQTYKGVEKLRNGFSYYKAFSESARQNQESKTFLQVPVLAVGGEHALGEQVGNAMKTIAANVETVSIKDCGHYVPEEQPEELTKLILQLVKGQQEPAAKKPSTHYTK